MTRVCFAVLAFLLLPVVGCGKGGDAANGSNPSDEEIIVVYSRENNSGTYMYFKEHVLENEDFAAGVQTLPGTAAVINAVSKDRRAIGYGGIGYIKGVRALPVRQDASSPAVEPTLDNVVSGSYPISRYLFFYTLGEPEGPVKQFLDWVRGDEGQNICAHVGYYPLPADKRVKGAPPTPAGAGGGEKRTVTIKGSDTMVILGQRWAEHYMQKQSAVLIQVTGGGSGTGIAALINGSTNICQSSRPMKAKEREQAKAKHGKDVVEFAVAMDGLAVFVHDSSALKDISLAQLKEIYSGRVKSWRELGAATK